MDWRKIEELIARWQRTPRTWGGTYEPLDTLDIADLAHYLADNLKPEASKT